LEKNVPGIKRTSDGRRRLTAPMWNPSV